MANLFIPKEHMQPGKVEGDYETQLRDYLKTVPLLFFNGFAQQSSEQVLTQARAGAAMVSLITDDMIIRFLNDKNIRVDRCVSDYDIPYLSRFNEQSFKADLTFPTSLVFFPFGHVDNKASLVKLIPTGDDQVTHKFDFGQGFNPSSFETPEQAQLFLASMQQSMAHFTWRQVFAEEVALRGMGHKLLDVTNQYGRHD